MTISPVIFRRGLDLKHEVAGVLAESYHSDLVEQIKATGYQRVNGRLQIFLSEDRGMGLVLKFSGEEARQAWAALNDPSKVPLIQADISSTTPGPAAGSDGRG